MKTLYFSTSAEDHAFHLSARKYEDGEEEWEKNNIELRAVWFTSREATFTALSNILNQAGISLVQD